jgi:large subunit ribosomal protein L27e
MSNQDKKYGHGLVVGIERYPRRVHQRMGAKKIKKRTTLKSFVKFVNLNHIMPTR